MPKGGSPKIGTIIGLSLAAAAVVGAAALLKMWRRVPTATGRITLLEVPIDALTMPRALARIEAFIRSGTPHHIFTADASGIMRAQDEPELLEIVRHADLVTPDGSGVLLASRMRGSALPERVSGVDLVEQISTLAGEKGYRIFLFGAADGVARAAADALVARHPGVTIAGTRHGFFNADEEADIVRQIAAARPDVLFVALGIPKQEQFIRRHFAELNVPVMIGVGGSFDVISGTLRRAPRWMQRAGLEWLFRFLQQPSRFTRLAALPRFILATWREQR